MPDTQYIVRFTTQIEVSVQIAASDEDDAADRAWQLAEDYANTLRGNGREIVGVGVSFDGIGADEVEEL